MSTKDSDTSQQAPPASRREAFLNAVEQKTTDAIHHRLLRACHSEDPASALEGELAKIILAILHEN